MRTLLRPDGTLCGPAPDLSAADLVRMLAGMLRIRLLDARLLALQRQGRIGFYGTATGEEAAVIGTAAALRDTDWIFPALRQGGALLFRGFPLARYVAQCIGNSLDPLKGRQMPCHASSRAHHVASWSSVIGTQVPHAAGAAMAARMRGDPTVVAGYLGDGATSSADFHVGLNFAAVFHAPVVFVCQNNQWAISVPFARQTAVATVAEKAVAYGIPGVRVDGNDVLATYEAMREAVDRARGGGGPTLLEAVTYRLRGHSSSDDPTRYRAEEEVAEWASRDPIERFRKHLLAAGFISESELLAMEAGIGEEISAAIAEAEAAPPLSAEALFTDVYAEQPWTLSEQAEAARGRTAANPAPDARFPL